MISPATDRGRVAGTAFILFCVALFLSAYSAKRPELARVGYMGMAELLRPLQLLTDGTGRRVSGVWEGYFALRGVREQNTQLEARLSTLEAENAKLQEIRHENDRLRNLLTVTEQRPLKSVAATVIGYDPSPWVRAVTLNRGSADGVSPDMAVVEGSGVVGRVVAVSANTSRVMLVTDRASSIDGLIQDSRVRGVVDGNGGSRADFSYVGEGEDLKIGDKVVTSGLDGIFPKGLIIGVITVVERSTNGLFKSIVVTPSVSLQKLESVLVVLEDRTQ